MHGLACGDDLVVGHIEASGFVHIQKFAVEPRVTFVSGGEPGYVTGNGEDEGDAPVIVKNRVTAGEEPPAVLVFMYEGLVCLLLQDDFCYRLGEYTAAHQFIHSFAAYVFAVFHVHFLDSSVAPDTDPIIIVDKGGIRDAFQDRKEFAQFQ